MLWPKMVEDNKTDRKFDTHTQIYRIFQSQDGDNDDNFCRENQPCPHSLSNLGRLRHRGSLELSREMFSVSTTITRY